MHSLMKRKRLQLAFLKHNSDKQQFFQNTVIDIESEVVALKCRAKCKEGLNKTQTFYQFLFEGRDNIVFFFTKDGDASNRKFSINVIGEGQTHIKSVVKIRKSSDLHQVLSDSVDKMRGYYNGERRENIVTWPSMIKDKTGNLLLVYTCANANELRESYTVFYDFEAKRDIVRVNGTSVFLCQYETMEENIDCCLFGEFGYKINFARARNQT